MTVYRYFIGDTHDRKVFAVYRAAFYENRILEEWKWQITIGTRWETTKSVSEWYYLGDGFLSPATEDEAMKYLPQEAKDKMSKEDPRERFVSDGSGILINGKPWMTKEMPEEKLVDE